MKISLLILSTLIILLNSEQAMAAATTLASVLCPIQYAVFQGNLCVHCIATKSQTPSANMKNKVQKPSITKNFLKPFAHYSSDVNDTGTRTDFLMQCLEDFLDIEHFKIRSGIEYLEGKIISIVTIERLPFVKISDGKFTGVLFEFLSALQTKYNFTMITVLPYDGNWGSQLSNGTWNGMIGMVVRDEVALGVATFSVTLDRQSAVDFTVAYHQEPSAILIPAPAEGEKLSVLIRPLSGQVWLAVGVTIGILVPSLYFLHIASLRINNDEPETKSWALMIGELFHFILGSLVQESVISPVDKTTRFLIAIWWLLSFILATVYVAFLVSYLSVPKLYNIVDSLEGLEEQNAIEWTFRLGTAHQDLFKSKESTGVYKLVGNRVKERDLVTTDCAGVAKVLTGKFAFIKEKSYLDVAIGQDFEQCHICRITLAKETFFTVGFAMAVNKKSIFTELLNYEILTTISTGLMEKWKRIHWPRNLWCIDAASYIISTQPKTRKLNFSDVHGAYFLLGCGVFFSLLSFIIENLVNYFHYRKLNSRLFIMQPIYMDRRLKDIKIEFVK